MVRTTFLGVLVALMCGIAAHAVPITGAVDGKSNIFKALPGGGGDGILPYTFDFSAGTEKKLTFSSVSGSSSCCGGFTYSTPDGLGGYFGATDVFSSGSISGIRGPGSMFLAGVFVDTTAPLGAAPARLDYFGGLSTSASSYTPLLNQAFFIGDGLTGNGTGSQQEFFAPFAANRLVLGFLDGQDFGGAPGFYNDNLGALNFTADLETVNPVPLPAGMLLILSALGVLGVAGWRRGSGRASTA